MDLLVDLLLGALGAVRKALDFPPSVIVRRRFAADPALP
jgi:hypothetical protein